MSNDCISITEKTFDLSLDDTQVDSDEEKLLPLPPTTTAQSGTHTLLNDDRLDECGKHSGNTNNDDLQFRNKSSRSKSQLKQCVKILQEISGTDVDIDHDCIINDDDDDDDDDIQSLLLQLCENCLLKNRFIEKNYTFLENLYESLQCKYKLIEAKYNKLKVDYENLRESQKNEHKLIYETLQRKLGIINSNNGNGSATDDDGIQGIITLINASPGNDQTTIAKQNREIREYKRFIKELMDR